MSCNHPKWAFKTSLLTESGKNVWLMSTDDEMTLDTAEKRLGERLPRTPGFFKLGPLGLYLSEKVRVPCGQCIGCKLDYSRAWATRCCLEAAAQDENCFITLTYSEANLPHDRKLHKEDFQKFMKRLRKKTGLNIRFFACGEYGMKDPKHPRPHWHALIFGYDFPDKKQLRGTDNLYISGELQKLWPWGLHSIGEMNYQTAAYTARYAMKAKTMPEGYKPILMMSRRPGLGWDYYQKKNKIIYKTDTIYFNFGEGMHRSSVPKYFDKLAEKDGYILDEVRARRIKKAEEQYESSFHFSDKDPEDQKIDRDVVMKGRASRLRRKL